MSIFELPVRWLAPPDCLGCGLEGASLCESCVASEIVPYGERCFSCGAISVRARTCIHCRGKGAPRYVWVATDYAGPAKELLQVYKFKHRRSTAAELALHMADTLRAYNLDSALAQNKYLVVGVPTATTRVRERGFDHAQLLARHVAKNIGSDHGLALARLGQSRQVGARRITRFNQKEHSYYVKNPDQVKGRNILLVDDVVTTGATLRTATRTLRAAGAKHVDALVFAKRI